MSYLSQHLKLLFSLQRPQACRNTHRTLRVQSEISNPHRKTKTSLEFCFSHGLACNNRVCWAWWEEPVSSCVPSITGPVVTASDKQCFLTLGFPLTRTPACRIFKGAQSSVSFGTSVHFPNLSLYPLSPCVCRPTGAPSRTSAWEGCV